MTYEETLKEFAGQAEFLLDDEYIQKFLNDMSKKEFTSLTENQSDFLQKATQKVANAMIAECKKSEKTKQDLKEYLIFYRDHIKTLWN